MWNYSQATLQLPLWLLLLHTMLMRQQLHWGADAGLLEQWGNNINMNMPDISGPLEGTMCNIEAVENANTFQLHSILTEISDRLFFRLVKVDTMAFCDYAFDISSTNSTSESHFTVPSSPTSSSATRSSSSDEEMCGAPTNAFAAPGDVGFGTNDPFGFMSSSSSSSSNVDDSNSSSGKSQCAIETEGGPAPVGLDWTMSKSESIANIGFAEKETSDCPTGSEDFSSSSMSSSAAATAATTAAATAVNGTYSTTAAAAATTTVGTSASYVLSPDFWLDLCDASNPGKPEFVNLKLNPERNTGYNGSHIWTAIYHEVSNMGSDSTRTATAASTATTTGGFTARATTTATTTTTTAATAANNEAEKPLETRFLHRLISGMHSSVTVSVMLNYYPPSKRRKQQQQQQQQRVGTGSRGATAAALSSWSAAAGEEQWIPNPTKFAEQAIAFPERLSNLHFTFVVVLRALFKAKNLLYNFDYATADASQLDHSATRRLVKRLLDSELLSVCSPVLSGFNETALFPKNELSAQFMEERQRLALEFKRAFQRITRLVGCVKCSRCRLHARVTFLGLGTALKVLLSDDEMLPKFLGRDEVVALVNTAHKLSESLVATNLLVEQYYDDSKNAVSSAARALKLATGLETAAVADWASSSSSNIGSGGGVSAVGETGSVASLTTASTATPSVKKLAAATSSSSKNDVVSTERALMSQAISLVLHAAAAGDVSAAQEDSLMDAIAASNDFVLALASQVGDDAQRFIRHCSRILGANSVTEAATTTAAKPFESQQTLTSSVEDKVYDLVVVGGGLAGMVAAISAADKGAAVVLLDKSSRLGGNSARASSGINAVLDASDEYSFREDTLRSCGSSAVPQLVDVLVGASNATVQWLSQRLQLPLPQLAQLGGHSRKRTRRPAAGLVGAELTSALAREVKKLAASITVITDAKAVDLVFGENADEVTAVQGVVYETLRTSRRNNSNITASINVSNSNVSNSDSSSSSSNSQTAVRGRRVLLSTGGFGYDSTGLLLAFAPAVAAFPTTLGSHTTGDGILLGLAAGAALVDMQYVQLHPTGFVDPQQPQQHTKVLCAELIRGVGGMLLDSRGMRFVDELATRKVVSDAMLSLSTSTNNNNNNNNNNSSNHNNINNNDNDTIGSSSSDLGAWLVLSDEMAQDAGSHMKMYEIKGLFSRMSFYSAVQLVGGSTGIIEYVVAATAVAAAASHQHPTATHAAAPTAATATTAAVSVSKKLLSHHVERKMYGRVPSIANIDIISSNNINSSVDELLLQYEQLLNDTEWWVARVRPVVHYTMGGLRIDDTGAVLRPRSSSDSSSSSNSDINSYNSRSSSVGRVFNSSAENAVAIAAQLSQLGEQRGFEAIPGLFAAGEVAGGVHGVNRLGGNSLLECAVFGKRIGEAAAAAIAATAVKPVAVNPISTATITSTAATAAAVAALDLLPVMSLSEVSQHSSESDCFTIIGGEVFDFSDFAEEHPGGANSVTRNCGSDGSEDFFAVHSAALLREMDFAPIARIA